MAAIPYVNIGDIPSAAQVNALNAAAEAKLVNLFSGLPPVLWGGGFKRRFFMLPGGIPSGPPFANVAQAYIYWCSQNPTLAPWLRIYQHTPFTNFVSTSALATVTAGDPRPLADSGYPCVRVTPPAGSGSTFPGDWIEANNQPSQTLVGSLEAHQKTFTINMATVADFTVPGVGSNVTVWVNSGNMVSVADALVLDSGNYTVVARAGNELTLGYGGGAANGTCVAGTAVLRGGSQVTETASYYIYCDGDLVAEHPELYQPIDVIFGDGVGSSFDWPSNWNKYSFIRFNNLQVIDMVVNFAPAGGPPPVVGVPAMRSTPIRRVATNMWDLDSAGLAYFFKLWPTDPMFLHLPPHDGQADHTDQDNSAWGSPATDFMCQARMLLENAPASLVMDWSQFDDISSTYCGSGKLFGDAASTATPVGDLLVHTGKIIVVDIDSETDLVSQTQNFTVGALPDTENLVMASGADAMGVTAVVVTRAGISIASSGNWSITATGTGTTITFLSGGALAPGDAVVVTFQSYRREPLFVTNNYTGLNYLAAAFVGTAITVTVPSPAATNAFRLSSTKNVHVIGIGTNLMGMQGGGYGFQNFASIAAGSYIDVIPGVISIITAGGSWGITAPHFTHASPTQTVNWTDLTTGNPMSTTFAAAQMTSDGGSTLLTLTPWNTIADINTQLAAVGGDATISLSLVGMTPAGPYSALAMSISPAAAHQDLAAHFTFEGSSPAAQTITRSFPFSDFATILRNQGNLAAALSAGTGPVGTGGFPDMSSNALEVVWPRTAQRWITGRIAQRSAETEPFSKQTADWTTVDESPLVSNWYEKKPFPPAGSRDAMLIPETNTNVNTAALALRLGSFLYWTPASSLLHVADDNLPAAYFLGYGQWTYTDPQTGATSTFDFTAGHKDRAGFYDTLWGGSPRSWGRYALPIHAEHYNLVAGIINGASGDFAAPALPPGVAEVLPPFTVGGGIFGYRPRTQFCHWNHSDTAASEIETWWTARGATIRTSADFVVHYGTGTISFATLMATNLNFVSDESTLATSETPGGSAAVPIWNTPPYMLNGAGPTTTDDYRWITIADAQTVYAALKIPFVFKELVVPVKLVLVDANLSHAPSGYYGGPLTSYGYPICRWANWICDSTGEWVIDSNDTTMTLDGWTGLPVIRANDSQIDYCMQNMTVTDFKGLESLFWGIGGYYFRQCQGNVGHSTYIYRRYGSPPAKAVMFGSNYADYQPRNGTFPGGGLTYVPRVAVTTLDGQSQVVDCSGADETVITTTLENAILLIWPDFRPL